MLNYKKKHSQITKDIKNNNYGPYCTWLRTYVCHVVDVPADRTWHIFNQQVLIQ